MPTSIRGFVHERRRWVALIIVCFAMLMNTLDQTIVNVALPTIQRDLHFTQASLAWVIDAYLITFAGALLLAGRLGDLIGRKKSLPGRCGAVHAGLGRLWRRRYPGPSHRGQVRPGARGGAVVVR